MAGLLVLAFTVDAGARKAFSDAPPQNKIQKKFYDWVNSAGGLDCKGKGAYAELKAEPYKLYLNIDESKAALDALTGKLDAKYIDVLADMIKLKKGSEREFLGDCPGQEGFDHLLGIMGVSYVRDPKHLPLLLDLIEGDKRLKKAGANIRGLVTTALWHMGNKEKAIPAFKRLLEFETRNDQYKLPLLKYLMRWNSDVGVEYCKKALVDSDKKRQKEACILYLGKFKVKAAGKLLVRGFEKDEEVTARALGLMGDKKNIKVLQEFLDENETNTFKRIPALVAMINLGKKEHMKELSLYLKGLKPEKKKKKAKKKKKKKKAKAAKADLKIIHRAAMEAVLLQDKKAWGAAVKLMEAAMKEKDKKNWQGRTYSAIALAQRGHKKAIKWLAQEINGRDDKVRAAIISGIGGAESGQIGYWYNFGLGVVGAKDLLGPLAEAWEAEGKKEKKVKIIRAYAAIRTAAEIK